MKAIVCALVLGLMVPSFAGAAIENIQVSNNTFVAVTISWTTDGSVMGEVHYSENPDLSNAMTAYDVRGQFFAGCTHYVEITGLTKETIYYFEVVAGGETNDNEGNYYTFRTMKQPQSPPTPCTLTGCVYEEDGTTLAVGPVVYLLVTHGGVDSYPLSDLLSDGDATPGCFAFDINQARSTVTHDLFSSVDPGDPVQVVALDCGNYRAESNLAYNGCFNNIGFLTLEYTLPGTTTTTADSSTTTTADSSTTTTADSSTTTTADSSTTTTADSSTTTTADLTTTPTTAPTTTPTTAPTTTPTTAPTTTPTTAPTTTSTAGGPCTTDAECDDGVYCNGMETCPDGACVPGTDPCADDLWCNGDESCDEGSDQCVPGEPPCQDDGLFCNGLENCDEEADACASSGDPCEENERCSEEDAACKPAIGIEASITGCGFPLFARLGVVEIQGGSGTDFKALSVVRYDSPLVIKSLKLLNRNTQTITQFVLLMPSIFFPAWNYPATVPVTVDTLSTTLEIPACGQ